MFVLYSIGVGRSGGDMVTVVAHSLTLFYKLFLGPPIYFQERVDFPLFMCSETEHVRVPVHPPWEHSDL